MSILGASVTCAPPAQPLPRARTVAVPSRYLAIRRHGLPFAFVAVLAPFRPVERPHLTCRGFTCGRGQHPSLCPDGVGEGGTRVLVTVTTVRGQDPRGGTHRDGERRACSRMGGHGATGPPDPRAHIPGPLAGGTYVPLSTGIYG